jgi:hypothetical protein
MKHLLGLLGATLIIALGSPLLIQAQQVAASPASVVSALVRQNEEQVETWLAALPARAASPREAGRLLKMSAAVYTHRESRFYQDPRLLTLVERLIRALQARQNADGSFDAEFAAGNPQSPPDSAFLVRHLALAYLLLRAADQPETREGRETLAAMLERSALVLRTGGVHTPNHRWVICSALSFLQVIQPAAANLARIDEWLSEGIDQDADGQFSERSTIYSAVTVEALLDLAVNLGRPELLAPIRKNLEFTLRLSDFDGELDTLSSRRQDQQAREPRRLYAYYLPLRYLAVTERQPFFAGEVQRIERDEVARIADHLPEWMVWTALRGALPTAGKAWDDFAMHFPHSGLVRIRRGSITASVFGGSDWAQVRDIASGLATNPTFFRFRKGAAVLESVRLTNGFFNLGYFRSEGLTASTGTGEYRLGQTQRAAYYQPLPAALRRADGDYALTSDGRFYSKMDFPNRPRDEKELQTVIVVRERADARGEFELEFTIDGTTGIGVTLELGFREGGVLTGTELREGDPGAFFLKNGTGTYQVGNDVIEFGPGQFGPSRISMAGEQYSWRNGQLRGEAVRVYVTGVTPFRHTLRIR